MLVTVLASFDLKVMAKIASIDTNILKKGRLGKVVTLRCWLDLKAWSH